MDSGGVKMTQEDFEFYVDNDCSTGEHALSRVGFHDILVEYTNYIAAGENDARTILRSQTFAPHVVTKYPVDVFGRPPAPHHACAEEGYHGGALDFLSRLRSE